MFLGYYFILLIDFNFMLCRTYVDGHNEYIDKHISMTHHN